MYGSFGSNGNTLFHGHTHAEAVEFLSRGRKSKYRRPIAKYAFLVMQGDWSISLVLHETCVVTYHEDSTYTLDHGGWRTKMTLAYINSHTPFRIGATYSRKYPGWGLGYTGEKTPPRVWKCRTCSGTGFNAWQMKNNPGQWNGAYGKCWRCDGKGRVDYGSERIPILWRHEPVKLAADKTIISLRARRYAYPDRAYHPEYGDFMPFHLIVERDDIRDLIAG